MWGHAQDDTMKQIKDALSSSEVLALYDPTRETILSANAFSYGLGAVLRQKQPNRDLRPIVYVSRALTETEQQYAQIEKGLAKGSRITSLECVSASRLTTSHL